MELLRPILELGVVIPGSNDSGSSDSGSSGGDSGGSDVDMDWTPDLL